MDDAIREVLLRDERIAYALIFGSVARGTNHALSDVDVAIGIRDGVELPFDDEMHLLALLESAVHRRVDLVILNRAPVALAYRVFRDGRVLFERDRAARVERQSRAILEYLDFKWVEEECARGVFEALHRG